MADVKISALPAVPVAVATTDLFAIVQGGVTYKATLTQVIAAIPDATGSTRGILSAADWTTFNSKQSALTFSTGLTNSSGTVTANLMTGVAGGQIATGGTGASDNLTLRSTTNATKGKILFGTSAYDEVNNRLGIGTASPASMIHNESTASAAGASDSQDNLILDRYSGGGAATIGANLIFRRARGSSSSPSAVQANDYLGLFTFRGYNGTAMTTGRAGLFAYASELWTATANGTNIDILTTPSGTTSFDARMRIYGSGNVVIQNGGVFSDSGFRLDVNGTARVQGQLTVSTGGASITGNSTVTGTLNVTSTFTLSDAQNFVVGTTTGTKIGTGTTQKLGFWNAAPIAQPTTAVTAATLVGGGGTNLTDTDTFDGYTLQQVVKALRNAGLLA